MKRPWRRTGPTWLQHSGQPGTLGGTPAERVAEAIRSEAAPDKGVGDYAAFAAQPPAEPAPTRPTNAIAGPTVPDPAAPERDRHAHHEPSIQGARRAREDDGDTEANAGDAAAEDNRWGPEYTRAALITENDRLRRALREERLKSAEMEERLENPAIRKMQQRLASDMAELLPLAKKQAMAGRPGLFRLITRAIGLRGRGNK